MAHYIRNVTVDFYIGLVYNIYHQGNNEVKKMSKFYDPETRFNKIYMFIGNTVTVASALLSLISYIVSKILSKMDNIPKKTNHIVVTFSYICIAVFILGMVLLFIRVIYNALKAKAEAFYIQKKLTEFIHIKLVHKIRNNIVELEPLHEKLNKFLEKNIDAISESYNFELKILQNNVKEYINELSTYLTNYRNSTISACIKIFKRRNRNRNEFQSEEIITLARSSNTEYERNNQKQTFVGQNTDFTNLCNGQIIFFGSSNLNKINESGHYINDSVNWESKKYTSTLVTPIRYYNDNYGNQRNINIKSDIIGFLCIDSKDEIKEWESSDSFELQMMAVFSDIIYVYIKEFYNCFEKWI